ncbi:hypothetical protein [Paramagnetospirillum marisnigri]|uniref:hypothetical protein n=1 Tax=Paramagnetospirillum marisnigri TaxID=1285242 RepID=UPI0008380E48|nr:hypothetical protein [Paramagnetospirillum marisnigri]
MTIDITAPDPPGPYLQHHDARMMASSHFLGLTMGVVPLVIALYLLATSGAPRNDGVWFLLGLFLVCGIPFSWVYAQTLLRMATGQAAGLQIAENDDHVEIVFFAGKTPCREQRYFYSEILDHGVMRIDFGVGVIYRPYIATPGLFGRTVKRSIPMAAFCDLRRFTPIYIDVVVADLTRILGRQQADHRQERHP